MYCKNCGSLSEEEDKFCKNCGAMIDGNHSIEPKHNKPCWAIPRLLFFGGLVLQIIYYVINLMPMYDEYENLSNGLLLIVINSVSKMAWFLIVPSIIILSCINNKS